MAATKESTEIYDISGSQLLETRRDFITTTLSSDIGLGGGVPRGCTVLVAAPPGTGKTTWSLQNAANAQQQYAAKTFVYPIEGRFSRDTLKQVQNLKTEDDWFTVKFPPPIKDKAGEIVGYRRLDAQKWWTSIGETIDENPGCVIIVDSIANLSTEKEQSEGMGYQGRGDLQKIESQFCRLYGSSIMSNKVTLFLLTQIQANVSGYGKSLLPKAGWHIRHQADLILFGKSVAKWDEEDGRIRGHDFVLTVEKSNFCAPYGDIAVPLRYGLGIDRIRDLLIHCVNWGIIEKSGAWYKMPFVENDGKLEYDQILSNDRVKTQGQGAAWEWLNSHKEQVQVLEKVIKEKVML